MPPAAPAPVTAPARGCRRRGLLLAAAAGGLATPVWASPPVWPTGWVKPRPAAPALALTDAQGRRVGLPAQLAGVATAVQLVFTGCGDVCPTQGLLFSQLAARHQARPVRWLSISIDALGDDPARLLAWQTRLGRHAAWQAAVPGVADVDRLVAFLRGGPASADAHTTQVFGFDRAGRLAYRTGDAPPVALLDALVDALLA